MTWRKKPTTEDLRRGGPMGEPHVACDRPHDPRTTNCLLVHGKCNNCGQTLHLALFADGHVAVNAPRLIP